MVSYEELSTTLIYSVFFR